MKQEFFSLIVYNESDDLLNPLTPKSDQHLTSLYNITTESNIKVTRIKKMIANPRSFDCSTNSPCQYQGGCMGKSMKNIDTDVRVDFESLTLTT